MSCRHFNVKYFDTFPARARLSEARVPSRGNSQAWGIIKRSACVEVPHRTMYVLSLWKSTLVKSIHGNRHVILSRMDMSSRRAWTWPDTKKDQIGNQQPASRKMCNCKFAIHRRHGPTALSNGRPHSGLSVSSVQVQLRDIDNGNMRSCLWPRHCASISACSTPYKWKERGISS